MELCAAVNASLAAATIVAELRKKADAVYMHTDSAVLMCYLKNKEKCLEFRVGIILNNTLSDHWFYVPTADNQADCASRATSVGTLMSSCCFWGPSRLWDPNYSPGTYGSEEQITTLPEIVESKQVTA